MSTPRPTHGPSATESVVLPYGTQPRGHLGIDLCQPDWVAFDKNVGLESADCSPIPWRARLFSESLRSQWGKITA